MMSCNSVDIEDMELQNLAESDSNDSQPYSDLDNEDVEIFKELYNSVFDSDIINTNSDSDAIIKQDENTNDNVQSEKGFIQKFHKYLITDNKEDAKKLLSNRFDLNKFKELRKKTIFHKLYSVILSDDVNCLKQLLIKAFGIQIIEKDNDSDDILLLLKTFLLTNDEKNIKLRLKDQFDLNEFKKSCLYYKMHSALVSNQVAIVKQLMNDEKLDLNKFLSERQLVALYVKMPSSSLYRFDTNNIFHAMYKALVFNTDDINRRVKLKYVRLIIKSMMLGGNKVLYQNKKYDNNTIETHLFTWAVLMNRQEMATLFWERIKNGNIATALFGGSILKGLAQYAGDKYMLDLEENLSHNAGLLEDMARSVLDIYYIHDPEGAELSIARKLPDWNNATCLSIANAGWHMKFMEHESCQIRLQKAWTGHLHIETTWQWIQFCIALLMPFMCAGMTFSMEMEQGETCIRSIGKLWLICVSPFKMIGFFMSPVTKFGYNCISYIILLGLFTWFVLTDLRPATDPNSPSTKECVVIFWVGTLIVEELRQMFAGSLRRMDKIKLWASDNWNRFDAVMYLWFIIVIILRYSLPVDQFATARMCYCISLLTFYIRSLQCFIINKQIGPKIIMIFKMMKDLFYFVMIIAVFAMSFGVAIEAILYPNMEPDIRIIFKSLYKPYWQLYGELFLEEIEGLVDNDTCHEDPRYLNQCPSVEGHRWVAPVLTAIYMLISSILLINLLIAVFSYTIDSVQEMSATVWRFYRYEIISEYVDRPTFAPPLIIINHIWRILGYLCCKCIDDDDDLKNEKDIQMFCGTSLRLKIKQEEHDSLNEMEMSSTKKYLESKKQKDHSSNAYHRNIDERLNNIEKMLRNIAERIQD